MTDEETASALPQVQEGGASNPFKNRRDLSAGAAEGTIAIESERAIAEAQGKLVVAKRFPRDPFDAMQRILDACKRPQLASSAIYQYKRGGENVRGPSIRLAEEMARCWGNVEYGLRELSNNDGVSEMEAYAWDLETNTYSAQRFTVRHLRDTRQGTKQLTDQRDIYEMTANQGARRMRARIMAILPDDVVDAAVSQCDQTIANGAGDRPLSERIQKMVNAFGALGITSQHLEKYLGHKVGETLPDELPALHGIYNAIKEGNASTSDYFGSGLPQPQSGDGDNSGAKPASKKKAASKKKTAARTGQAESSQQDQQTEEPPAPPEEPAGEPEEPPADEAPGMAEPQGGDEPPQTQADTGQGQGLW